jgi:hypothetical protein
MTEPEPVAGEQGAPELEESTTEPDPAVADVARRQWDDSLWHRAPTPQYRP